MNEQYGDSLSHEEHPKHRTLKDVELPDIFIDDRIQNLVRALRSIDVPTEGSCEGHLDMDKHQHPWVTFSPLYVFKRKALSHLVDGYNQENDIRWYVNESSVQPLTHIDLLTCCNTETDFIPYNQRGPLKIPGEVLGRLQNDSDILADYIFNNRKNSVVRELVARSE